MIILNSTIEFEASYQSPTGKSSSVISAIVYDDKTDRFVKVNQRISLELQLDLNANQMIDINDVINLDHINYVFKEEEIGDIFKIVDELPDNEVTEKVKKFIIQYKRERKINEIL